MAERRSRAPGAPGIAPTWSGGAKDAVGTAHASSRVWFTIGRGIINEVYWPRVDRPQIRDLGFIVADDAGFWSEVKRDARQRIRQERPGVPAITMVHEHDAYRLTLRVCTDTFADVLRIEAALEDRRVGRHASAPGRGQVSGPGRPGPNDHDDAPSESLDAAATTPPLTPLRLYPLLAPHLGFSGHENRAWVGTFRGRDMAYASKGPYALALASDPAPRRQSVGYVGSSDGWSDFSANGRMTWAWSETDPGNVALMTEIVPVDGIAQLALGFGPLPEAAALQAVTALASEFDAGWDAYVDGWQESLDEVQAPPSGLPPAERALYLTSATVLRTLEDRTQPGAIVASLSIPWGSSSNDLGGYHLVWSRDLVECAGALVALDARDPARRTLAYLVASQEPDGHWPQNQWLDGDPYSRGVQLDEAAYPILLAGALTAAGADPDRGASEVRELLRADCLERMVCAAAGFLARHGPVTEQDRWEENPGLSPSTLAPVVAALVVAAEYLPGAAAAYCLDLADDWNASIEDWTYAQGTRLARAHGVEGHYIRIAAPEVLVGAPLSTPVTISNRPSGTATAPGDEVIGTDFLALVRFGLRAADDPRIVGTLRVADALLRTETPMGPTWHRYTGDGYGEHEDGRAYDGTGVGRGWPLLVGERGHYELCAGHDVAPYLAAMTRMTSRGGLLPEQTWDAEGIPSLGLSPGHPSGSATPLAWAHAEYVKLVLSTALGRPIDRPAAAWRRYGGVAPAPGRQHWRFGAQRPTMPAGRTLRIETLAPARVRATIDGWRSWVDLDASDTGLGVWWADVPGSADLTVGATIAFTFWWPEAGRWEGRDLAVVVTS